jgi:hypothetical protein
MIMKKLFLLPLLALLACSCEAQMPIFRNQFTTNVPSAYVRGNVIFGDPLGSFGLLTTGPFTNRGTAYFEGGTTEFWDGIIVQLDSTFWGTVTASNQIHSTNFMLLTPQWDDVRIPVGALGSPSSQPGRDNFVGTIKAYAFDADADEELHFELQLPHGLATNFPVDLHIHWSAINASVGANSNVVWGLEYVWANTGGTFQSSSTTVYATNGIISPREHRLVDLLELNGYKESAVLVGRLFRDADNGSDTYPNDAYGLSLDAHYPRIQMGSFQELGDY